MTPNSTFRRITKLHAMDQQGWLNLVRQEGMDSVNRKKQKHHAEWRVTLSSQEAYMTQSFAGLLRSPIVVSGTSFLQVYHRGCLPIVLPSSLACLGYLNFSSYCNNRPPTPLSSSAKEKKSDHQFCQSIVCSEMDKRVHFPRHPGCPAFFRFFFPDLCSPIAPSPLHPHSTCLLEPTNPPPT